MELERAFEVLRGARRTREVSAMAQGLPGTRIGDYVIEGPPLGAGGSGEVYPVRHADTGGAFALKWARPDLLHADQIFKAERHKAGYLNHANILIAHDSGVHQGRPFLVFRRLEGHLTNEVRRQRYASEQAILELMQKLSGALRFAHGRLILHCDLKPENILLGSDGAPHIADFGLARRIEEYGSSGEAWGGSDGWMSPEQVEKRKLGVESDLFSLGVLLYWLLSDGRLPFGKGSDFKRRVLEEEPEPLARKSRFARPLSWDLAAICRKALHKNEQHRYRSAAELESDLLRAEEGRVPAMAGATSSLRRASRWARSHGVLALLGLCALGLPPYALSIQNRALEEVRSAQRPQLRFSAVAQASAVVSDLLGMGLRVQAMAQDPRVVRLLEHSGIGNAAPALEAHAAGFDSVNVFSADGIHRARWPVAPEYLMGDVRDVDHFQCAQRLAQALAARSRPETDAAPRVCVARAHRSNIDLKIKLGIAAPILVGGRLVGVAEASTMARERFGAVQMKCGHGDCFTALLGPRDRDAPGHALPEALSILAQSDVTVGSEKRLPVELSRRICAKVGCAPDPEHPFRAAEHAPFEIEPYTDPGDAAQTLAAVAPVARTGLSVLIATPYSASEGWLARIAWAALGRVWVPLAIAFGVWLLLFYAPNPRWPWPTTSRAGYGK